MLAANSRVQYYRNKCSVFKAESNPKLAVERSKEHFSYLADITNWKV